MAKAVFRCGRCKRKFSMAAHLGRHVKAIHGSNKARKKTVRTKAGKRTGRIGRPKRTGGGAVRRRKTGIGAAHRPFAVASRLLSDMRIYHKNLIAQRVSLDGEIDAIASAMQSLGAAARGSAKPSGGRVGRATASRARRGSLKEYIVRVLSQRTKPISPNEIGVSVKKAGFKTKAKDLTKAVSNTLPKLKNVRRVGFGLYQLQSRAQ